MTQAPPSRSAAATAATGTAPGTAAEAPDLSEGWGEQRGRLRKDLHRLDVLICTLVGLDTIGSVAAQGPRA
ncbi:hypothetical protein [Streptomyces altiplanensis]